MKHWHLAAALICLCSFSRASEWGPKQLDPVVPVDTCAWPHTCATQDELAFVQAGRHELLLAQAGSTAAPIPPAAGPMDGHYLRFMDPHHIQQSASMLYSPSNRFPAAGVTDVCAVTHSTADGSIIPKNLWSWLPPEDWCALEVGAGGQWNPREHGNAIVDAGLSANVAPQLLGWTAIAVTSSSPQWLQVYKSAITSSGGNVHLRLGVGEEAHMINGGLIAVNQMLPGSGLGDILNKNLVLKAGVAWHY